MPDTPGTLFLSLGTSIAPNFAAREDHTHARSLRFKSLGPCAGRGGIRVNFYYWSCRGLEADVIPNALATILQKTVCDGWRVPLITRLAITAAKIKKGPSSAPLSTGARFLRPFSQHPDICSISGAVTNEGALCGRGVLSGINAESPRGSRQAVILAVHA